MGGGIYLSNFPNTFYWRDCLYSIGCTCLPCPILINHKDVDWFRGCFLFHWSLCLFLCQYQFVVITVTLQYSLISGIVIPPTLFFSSQDCWGYLESFLFHISFWNICSRYVEYAIVILIGIALNLQLALGSMDILMMLIIPIHEHGICFHLFVSYSISFFRVL